MTNLTAQILPEAVMLALTVLTIRALSSVIVILQVLIALYQVHPTKTARPVTALIAWEVACLIRARKIKKHGDITLLLTPMPLPSRIAMTMGESTHLGEL